VHALQDVDEAVLVVPAGQVAQWFCPSSRVPAPHAVQLAAPARLTLPASQCVQVAAPLAEYVPAVQLTQVEIEPAPTTEEAVPAAHGVHDVPLEDQVPTPQLVQLVEPVPGATVPGAHATQVPWPPVAVYWPAGHCVHAPAPVGEYVPAAQLAQLVAPVVDAKVPEGHAEHEADPVVAAYVPTVQFVHALAPPPDRVPAGQLVHVAEPVDAE
jgi:hypothetical protein